MTAPAVVPFTPRPPELLPHEKDKLRRLVNAFEAETPAVRAAAVRMLRERGLA